MAIALLRRLRARFAQVLGIDARANADSSPQTSLPFTHVDILGSVVQRAPPMLHIIQPLSSIHLAQRPILLALPERASTVPLICFPFAHVPRAVRLLQRPLTFPLPQQKRASLSEQQIGDWHVRHQTIMSTLLSFHSPRY